MLKTIRTEQNVQYGVQYVGLRKRNAEVREAWLHIWWLGGVLFIKNKRRNRQMAGDDERKRANSKGETRKERQTRMAIKHRRETLKRIIRDWTKALKLKYDGKVERKYRNKERDFSEDDPLRALSVDDAPSSVW
eukprot:2512272-Pleurochrysis_carterae.AAC.2